MTTLPQRTRDNAGSNEVRDIETIVSSIHNKTPNGLRLMDTFKTRFGLDVLDARKRLGNRGVHYDFQILVGPEPGVWKNVEHKGSQNNTPILPDQTPWSAGVQFHNGGCEKYSIGKKYAETWYTHYIASGSLKNEFNLQAPTPTFDEWFRKDVKCQGDPKTAFGKELKETVRRLRGPKASLLDKRQAVNELFTLTDEDLLQFKLEVLTILNEVLSVKDYWLTIHGDPASDFSCAWYPNFTLKEIKQVTMKKELDIWFEFDCAECKFSSLLRWGKGAGFSNLRIDAR